MRYCLNAKQTTDYLRKADEIKFTYADRKAISRYAEDFPHTPLIICHTLRDEAIDWKQMQIDYILSKKQLILSTESLEEGFLAMENDIPFFLDLEITSFYQLNAIKELNPAYIRLGAPLFFEMEKVKQITSIPIRVIPNVAIRETLFSTDGVHGTWIRPEDLAAYDKFVDICEFEDCDLKKEQALYRIYAEQHNWPGQMNILITGLDSNGTNRMISSEMSQKRINCGQRCQENGKCHLCERILQLADPNEIKEYIAATKPE